MPHDGIGDKIYDRTLIAVFKENRKVLRDMVKESNDLFYQSRERKYTLLPTLKNSRAATSTRPTTTCRWSITSTK